MDTQTTIEVDVDLDKVPLCERKTGCDNPAAWVGQMVHEDDGAVDETSLTCVAHKVFDERIIDRVYDQGKHFRCRPHHKRVHFVWRQL